MRYLSVRNFERFQHYRDRAPVWIKLYNSLLDDYDFLALSDAARSQLMLLWLVASRQDNRIPHDPKWIARAIHATGKLHLAELIASGWLIPLPADAERSASGALAEAEQDASDVLAEPERNGTAPRALARERGREEREGETDTSTSSTRAAAIREQLPEAYRDALDATIACVRLPAALLAELEALHEDAHATGTRYTWAEIGLGLHDLVANGKHEQFNARQLRRYVADARGQMQAPSPSASDARPRSAASLDPTRKLTIGERVFLKAQAGGGA